jgi:hypothetical protein
MVWVSTFPLELPFAAYQQAWSRRRAKTAVQSLLCSFICFLNLVAGATAVGHFDWKILWLLAEDKTGECRGTGYAVGLVRCRARNVPRVRDHIPVLRTPIFLF